MLIYLFILILATTDCPSGVKPGIAEDPEYPGRLKNNFLKEGVFEKEDFMKDDEAQEISGKMRKESKMYNQGI